MKFQLTAPRRSRQLVMRSVLLMIHFNSRLHEGADQANEDHEEWTHIFQLTAPRRSRQSADSGNSILSNFNSRLHEGADFKLCFEKTIITVISTHGSTKEPTHCFRNWRTGRTFQLTAPRRSRQQFQTKNTLLKLHNLYILYTFQLLTKFFDHF